MNDASIETTYREMVNRQIKYQFPYVAQGLNKTNKYTVKIFTVKIS